MTTSLLLVISNIFMTFAWYGHLKYKNSPLWGVILVSWLIAFFEYCFQVPANRVGHGQFSAAQLKTIQEVITLVVFCFFSVFYLIELLFNNKNSKSSASVDNASRGFRVGKGKLNKEELKWNYAVGFLLIVAAVFFIFKKW